jgi:polyhydroxyalkanoate synthase
MMERGGELYGEVVEAASRAVEALQPESSLIGQLDMAGLGEALRQLVPGWARHPAPAVSAVTRYWAGMAAAGLATFQRAAGAGGGAPISADPKDRRFADPAWKDNAWFFALQQNYLLGARLLRELVEAADLPDSARAKVAFTVQAAVDALAPTNTLAGNPAALKKAFDTGGLSVVQGARNFLDDVVNNGGMPRQVDTSPFEVGRNLAATGGVPQRPDGTDPVRPSNGDDV